MITNPELLYGEAVTPIAQQIPQALGAAYTEAAVGVATLGLGIPEISQPAFNSRSRDELATSAATIGIGGCMSSEFDDFFETTSSEARTFDKGRAARLIAGLNRCNSSFIEQPSGVVG